MTNLIVSATKSATVVVQNKTTAKKIPSPLDIQPKGFKAKIAGFFQKKQVVQLASNPLPIKEEAAPKEEEPKKLELTEKAVQVQKLLKDTTCSTFNKLKKLLPIPKAAAPIIDMLLGKTTKYGVKVEVANNSLTFKTEVKMPGQGINGSVIVDVPLSAEKEDEVTELHPVIVNQLDKALNPLLSGEEQVQEIIKLLSTVPSQNLSLSWKDGFVRIDISLPKGVSIVLNLKLPTSAEAAQEGAAPDILRTFLKSILKENYAGIETLLSKSMTFTWDGSTSRFDLEFADQLVLEINDFSEPAISSKILKKLVHLNVYNL